MEKQDQKKQKTYRPEEKGENPYKGGQRSPREDEKQIKPPWTRRNQDNKDFVVK